MKLNYENPMMAVIGFDNENIVTVSGPTLASDALEVAGATDIQTMDLAGEGTVKAPNIVW